MKICDAYVRVSQVQGREGESFISPTAQREAIEGWARGRGHQLGRVLEELDESGGRADRPLLLEAIARQESGEAQVLAVAMLDRFGRDVLDGLLAIKRVTDAGGSFVSVREDLDFSSPTGRLFLHHMLSHAEWELDRVRATWADAQDRAIRRGLFLGSVPLGYRRTDSGRLRPDAKTAPLALELFARAGRGEGPSALAAWLTEQGVPTATGGVWWSPTTVQSLLGRRVYVGESKRLDVVNRAAHEPLVDAATWQAAQRHPTARVRTRRPTLLAALLRCSGCSRVLGARRDSLGRVIYQCPRHSAHGRCPAPVSIHGSVAEPYAEAVLWGLLRSPGLRRQGTVLKHAEDAAQTATTRMAAYRDNASLPGVLGDERFAAGLAVRVQREEAALCQLAAARRAVADEAPDLAATQARWPGMTLDERRELIASQLAFLVVLGRGHRPRLWALPAGGAPTNLPAYGRRRVENLGSLDPEERGLPRANPAPGSFSWSQGKVAKALEPFMAGHDQWPEFAVFQAAGLALAHANALRHKNAHRWAEHLRVDPPVPNRPDAPSWTDERIRRELTAAFGDADRWPTHEEFCDRGLRPLREGIRVNGGAIHWARELGLPLGRNQNRTRKRWDLDAMREGVRTLAAGQDDWPHRRQFLDAGLQGLYHAIGRNGVRAQLAAELGLDLPNSHHHARPGRWDQAAIDRTLKEFLAGRETYPILREWKEAGLQGLYRVIDDRGEGHNPVAKRYGLRRRWAR